MARNSLIPDTAACFPDIPQVAIKGARRDG
jgi:hypothetical protein